jgi:hypothetical protein
MADPRIIRSPFWEIGPNFPTAQFPDEDGNLYQTTDFSAVQLRVLDLSSTTPATAVYSNTRVLGDVMTNTPASWDLDDVGYNFRDTVTTNMVAFNGGRTYRLEYTFTLTSGNGTVPLVFEGRTESLFIT